MIRAAHLGDWGTPFGMLIEHALDIGEDSADADQLRSNPNAFYQAARRIVVTGWVLCVLPLLSAGLRATSCCTCPLSTGPCGGPGAGRRT